MRRFPLSVFAAAAAVIAAPAVGHQSVSENEIVVTGKRLADTERALRECLARKCPPLEDIAATLAHAENQFVSGLYGDARRTLGSSIRRNGKHAKAHPVGVSGLYRADSRIAIHMGEGEDHQTAATGIVRALKAGLPDNDPRVLIGMFDMAQMHINLKRYHSAMSIYDQIAEDAERTGATYLQGQAELRSAALSQSYNKNGGGKQRLEKLARSTHPELRTIRLGAMILLARIDRQSGGSGASDALIRELMAGKFERALLHSPPIQPIQFGAFDANGQAIDPFHHSVGETGKETWVDVGFRVSADGRVEEPEVLRSNGSTGWTNPLLKAISERLYSPAKEDAYKVERYSYTSLKTDVTGTRMRRHTTDYFIEQIDLTAN